MVMVAVPLLSVALGASKVQALPNCTVLLVLLVQFITGAVVSTTVTVWLHWSLLVQASVACLHSFASRRSSDLPAVLVTVLRMVMVAVPLLSVAVGRSKVQALPNCTDLLVLSVQFITGAVVSTTVTVWLHWALLLQASVACQVRVASKVLPQ